MRGSSVLIYNRASTEALVHYGLLRNCESVVSARRTANSEEVMIGRNFAVRCVTGVLVAPRRLRAANGSAAQGFSILVDSLNLS